MVKFIEKTLFHSSKGISEILTQLFSPAQWTIPSILLNFFEIELHNKSSFKGSLRSHTKTCKGKKINPSYLELAREDPSNILKLINN